MTTGVSHFLFMTAVALISLIIGAATTLAGNYDGSKNLFCAAIETRECGYGNDCLSGHSEDVDFPPFIIIDFEKKEIRSTEEFGRKETTGVQAMTQTDGKLILQGTEAGRGWTLVISERTGKMVLTASGEQIGFVVFGACSAR